MNDITTFNQKRQSCSNTKWVSLKMCEGQFFQVCLLTNEGPWYHSETERLRCTKDYFYFYPQIFPCLLASPLYSETGRWHISRFSKSFSQSCWLQEQYHSLDILDSSNVLLSHWSLFQTWFVKEKDLFSTYFGMAHMILTIYLLEPKKHLKFLELEGSVRSITLILEIDYKSLLQKYFLFISINGWKI